MMISSREDTTITTGSTSTGKSRTFSETLKSLDSGILSELDSKWREATFHIYSYTFAHIYLVTGTYPLASPNYIYIMYKPYYSENGNENEKLTMSPLLGPF